MNNNLRELVARSITSVAIVACVGGCYVYSSWSYTALLIALFFSIAFYELPALIPRKFYAGVLPFYPTLSLLSLYILNNQYHEVNPLFPLYPIIIAAAADTGGYCIGKLIGRHKMCPRISPGKSWEGFAGGIISVGLIHTLMPQFFDHTTLSWVSRTWPSIIATSILMASIAFLGGFVISLFKRHQGVKDTGTLLPGHGGLLDRCDSIFFTAPFTLLLVILSR